jgi:hypothetical protein
MNENHISCPYCKEDILSGAIKCKHCGEWLNEHPVRDNKDLISTLIERILMPLFAGVSHLVNFNIAIAIQCSEKVRPSLD